MKKIISVLSVAICMFASCEKYDTVKTIDDNFVNNYEAFWNMVNENYCFLGTAYGNTKNVDWQAVYDTWMPEVKKLEQTKENEYKLFNIIGKSLDVLRDGHIWMTSPFKKYSNEEYRLKPDGVTYYDNNFVSGFVQNHYLNLSTGKDDYTGNKSFKTKNGFVFGTIERDGKKFAYIYHSQFTKEFTDQDMVYLDPLVKGSDGLILDIRNNPGGSAIYGLNHGNLFFKEKTHIGYTSYKTGSGHDDFSEPNPMYCIPSDSKYDWSDIPTALLINRQVYSTANLFTYIMSLAPNVTLVGQISGGGGGMPMSHLLPNGWDVVFSSNVLLDINKKHIEDGVKPDVEADMGDYATTGKDGIVEAAITQLQKVQN